MDLDSKYIAAARRIHGREGEVEIDGGALVSYGGDPGAYVQAWVWVPADQIDLPEHTQITTITGHLRCDTPVIQNIPKDGD